MAALKSAIDSIDEIMAEIGDLPPAVFLDFDGTLAPIARDPDRPRLSEAMHRSVSHLAERCTVAVVSGRGLEDVQKRVRISDIAYAGSHGFEIRHPDGTSLEKGGEFLPALDRAEAELNLRTGPIEGVIIERKRFSVAVHYRNVAAQDIPTVKKRVNQILSENPRLRATRGKKIFDLQPDIDWDKGKAVAWLFETLKNAADAHNPAPMPLYIGDDVTDEYAFKALKTRGITISVQSEPQDTAAKYRLEDPDEVQQFLDLLARRLPVETKQ